MTVESHSEPCVGDPPACCQPEPLTDAEWRDRTARLTAARERALAAQPKACPRCGSDEIYPTFDPDGAVWACSDCPNVWEQDR